MILSGEQYLGLSALAYLDFSKVTLGSERSKISELVNPNAKPEYGALASLGNWRLINASTTLSGFQAYAFKSPDGQIVFSFCGTQNSDVDALTHIRDMTHRAR